MREENEMLKNQYYRSAGNIEEGWFQRLRYYLSSRQRVKVNVRFITLYYVQMFFCYAIGQCSRKKKLNNTEKQYNLFKNGEIKILQELDTVNLILRLRQLEILVSRFLNKDQQLLINFQKKNILREEVDLYSSSEDEHHFEVYQSLTSHKEEFASSPANIFSEFNTSYVSKSPLATQDQVNEALQ